MIRLYKSFILPHLEYCSPVLVGIGKTEYKKREDANYYILRTILDVTKSESFYNKPKLNILQIDRRYFHFNCMKEHGSQHFFKLRTVSYNLRDSGKKLEQLPFKTKWLKNSYSLIISRLWKSLPVIIRQEDTIKIF